MTEEQHLIGRLIGDAVVMNWRGGVGDLKAGFDYREVEEHFLAALRAKGYVVMSAVDHQKLMFAAGFDDRAPDLAGVAGKGFPLVEMLTTDPRDFFPPTPEHKEG